LIVSEAGPWRFPIAFGNEELHGLEALLPLRVIAIAHADEAIIVLGEKERGGGVARAERPPAAIDEAR
jgi:hypothetical protein